jgi:hypothetical protein
MSAHCFLCRFSNHRDAVDMNQFIEENMGFMNLDAIAREVHLELINRNHGMTDSEPMTEQGVREHITSHTLNPVIRVGIMLRGLLDLDDKMKNDLYKVDAQGQCLGLDPKMIDAYLRLQNQVINLYKSDPSKLPYYKLHGGGGGGGGTSNNAVMH